MNKNFYMIIAAISVLTVAACTTTTGSAERIDSSGEPSGVSVTMGNDLNLDGYSLVWEDNFDGPGLNRNDWNVELHEPGWVNEELQEYVDSEKNIFIENGNLVIRPVKSSGMNGKSYYTSGRISTQNKKDFTYGVFEARLKVPEGKGFLPAFWLMATDENIYGQWPRCGEIDIMEVHGSDTKTTYATIHYGNPHRQSQATKTLDNGTFADGFHTYAVKWEPGEISWYVDGFLIHSENEWYSITEGQGEITYPAPFDQPFYIILNLAVGGSWVGYPDRTTDFKNARYEVDYVKVWQKENYDENVTKPEKEVVLRDPDENGNFIVNGDFSTEENLSDNEGWIFLTTNGGDAKASVFGGKLDVTVKKSGNVDYSVQLVQPGVPIQKGGVYEVSFDAWSTGKRTMLVGVSAPDLNYIRYMPDTKVELTTKRKTYRYEFTMDMETDGNGRLEFNMGNTPSTDDIFISSVSVKLLELKNSTDNEKSKQVLADGNYIYNGKFQEGNGRLGFWEIENNGAAIISVTDFADGRRLSIDGMKINPANALVLRQSGLALAEGAYVFTADIEGKAGDTIMVKAGGTSFPVVLEKGRKNYSIKFSIDDPGDKNVSLTFSSPGVYLIDNVALTEDSLIRNGSFNAGFSGFEPYAYAPDNVRWVVDSLSEDNAADFTIIDTGNQTWHIQLKQNGIHLEKGQRYRLSFDAKSSVDRKIMFAIQRDGSKHNDDWTPYSGEKIVALTDKYETFSLDFTMNHDTDDQSVFSLSMGAVDGKRISKQHRICIDNIILEKTDSGLQ